MDDQNFQQNGGYQQYENQQPQQDVYQQPQYGYQQPQQDVYQQPQYGYQQPQQAAPKGASIAALVLGVLGIVGGFIPVVCYFTAVLSILGIIFGASGQKKAREYGTTSGLATAGLVCGIIGTVFSLSGIICALACAGTAAAGLGVLL